MDKNIQNTIVLWTNWGGKRVVFWVCLRIIIEVIPNYKLEKMILSFGNSV